MTDAQPDHPALMTRLLARLNREVSAQTLDAYHRAGLAVYDLISAAEARRAELASAGAAEVDHATRCFVERRRAADARRRVRRGRLRGEPADVSASCPS